MRGQCRELAAADFRSPDFSVPGDSQAMPLGLTIFSKGLILVSIPLLFQLAFIWLVADMQATSAEAQARSSHSKEVLTQTQVVLRSLLDAETGSHGFLLTEDPLFSAPYQQSVREIPSALPELQQL